MMMSMNQTTGLQTAAQPAARLSGLLGYRIEGDAALLLAQIEWQSGAEALAPWSLQLWATPSEAAGDAVKVAELKIDGTEPFGLLQQVEGWTLALPPAGHGPQQLSLSLVSANGTAELHDQTVFDQPEQFVQPVLEGGSVGWSVDPAGPVSLRAVTVRNPRPEGNLSGSLSLELWVLDQPYGGGSFSGQCIARSDLGTLAGQSCWQDVMAVVPSQALVEPEQHLVLMLREWTAIGPVSRDYAVIDMPVFAEPAAAAPVAAEPAPAELAVHPVEAVPAAPAQTEDPRPSINQITAAELSATKGITKAMAKAIVAARPFASFEAIGEVHGIGRKTLEKLRELFRL